MLESRKRGVLDVGVDEFYSPGRQPGSLVTELRDGRCWSNISRLPDGGSFRCTRTSASSASCRATRHDQEFLESVIDNIPVCVAVKNIDDGKYILANRAFEQFSRFPREKIVGYRAEEIFRPETAGASRRRTRRR